MIHNHKTSLTEEDFRNALSKISLTKNEIRLLKTLYELPNHKATGLELKKLLNHESNGGINLTFSRIAKKISKKTNIYPSAKRKNGSFRWWSLLAIGEEHGDFFSWKLKEEFVSAIEKENIIDQNEELKLEDIFPVIRRIIRQKNLSQLWVDRDEIAQKLKEHIVSHYGNLYHAEDWRIGSLVDWFSASFTKKNKLIEPYLSEFERKRINKKNSKGLKRKIWAYRIKQFSLTEEIDELEVKHVEGKVSKVIVNRYERDSKARLKCINHFGANCQVCNFRFENMYGEIGKDFIHVHHIKEISTIGEEYEVNPIEDLIPVCPNCHAMLHKKKPAYSIEALRQIIKTEQNKNYNGNSS